MLSKYKHIYWCEDCLLKYGRPVIAYGAYQARKFFASMYGYYTVDVYAKRLARLPNHLQGLTDSQIPDDITIRQCGIWVIDTTLPPKDDLEAKIITMAKRGFREPSHRIIYCKDLKSRFIFQEKI